MPYTSVSGVIARKSTYCLSVRLAWPFIEVARQHDAPLAARLQSQLGLTRWQLEHPDTRIPLKTARALLTELIEQTGMPCIGLLAAQRVTAEHLALAEYLARSKDTLGAALKASVQYAQLLCDGAHHCFELKHNLAIVRFWFDNNCAMPDAAYEFVLATQLNGVRRMTGIAELAPLEVHFMHAQPRDPTLHERTFDCKLRFNMPFTQLVLPANLLALTLPGAEPALNRLLEQQANLSLAGLPTSNGLVARARNLLVAELGLGKMSNKLIAQRFGMSSRTLARRLSEENTSYQQLFDQTRRELALRDLTETQRPIRDIAKRLGFGTSQSFHRAFRRWTGASAKAYRVRSKRRELRSDVDSGLELQHALI